MAWPPTVADFKSKFDREFSYGPGLDQVRDKDIERAIGEAGPRFNQSLLDTEAEQTSAFLFLVAHLMVLNIQAAGGLSAVNRGNGVRNVGEGVAVASGVGPASVSYQVPPDRIARSPMLLFYFQTTFGQMFAGLMEPLTAGNLLIAQGPNEVSGI